MTPGLWEETGEWWCQVSIITQWSHDGCCVYNGPGLHGLNIIKHPWSRFMMFAISPWEQASHLRVSYFSQFPTRYRYPGIVTSSVSRDKCDVTWRGSHRSCNDKIVALTRARRGMTHLVWFRILFTSVDNPELYVSALWALAASVDWATGTITVIFSFCNIQI